MRREDSIEALRAAARRRLPRAVFDFIDGGAETESALRRNMTDLARIHLTPRALAGRETRKLEVTVLGRACAFPLVVAPTGLAALAHPRADLALARAAQSFGVPFVTSTSSSVRLEDIAAAAPGARLWFQAYPYKDPDLVGSLLARAAATGYEAVVLTVDVPLLGHRRRDHANRFTVPLRPTPRLVADLVRCLPWSYGIIRHGVPRMENLVGYGGGGTVTSLADLMNSNLKPAADWADLARIRDAWPGKLLIKGVMHPQDAETALRYGVDAIVVSNHGGRQLDASPSTISVLPSIAAAVGGRAEIILDGGVRHGADIARAMALGATCAMAGRPTLYGVAAGGELGARQALQILRTDFDRTLAMLGCATPEELGSSHVGPRSAHAPA